jgi:hypothetical protein
VSKWTYSVQSIVVFDSWGIYMFCRKRVELVTYFMGFGFLTSLWSVYKRMVHGLSSVPVKLQG